MKESRIKNIPKGMRKRRQWVAFKVWMGEDGKLKKMPINPHNGTAASVSDPESWGTLGEVMAARKQYGCQAIGFALTKDDPYFFVDLDKCVDLETSEVAPWAMEIVHDLNTYTERSVSGTGLHAVGEGTAPEGGKKKGQVEIYDRERFVIMTGNLMPGTPTEPMPRQKELEELHAKVFGEPKPVQPAMVPPTSGLDLSEEEIIQRAGKAKNGAKFLALWSGDMTGFGSHSEADGALCCILAFWTNNDPVKMDMLFRKSGLMRDKWDEKHSSSGKTYGQMTIENAINFILNNSISPQPDGKELIDGFLKRTKEDPKAAIREALANESVMNAMADLSRINRRSYESVMVEVKHAGATVRDVESVKKAVNASARKNKLRLVQPGEQKELTRVKDIFPDAPVGDDLVIPPGWQVREDGVFKEKLVGSPSKGYEVQRIQATFSPILLQKKLVDGSDGTEGYCLLWLSEGEWKTHPVGRGDMADARLIIRLAEFGLPVTTPTANLVVEYLAAFEAANSGRMPKGKLSSHMGWQGEKGDGGFLWGENFISTDGTIYKGGDIKKSPPHELPAEVVFLKPKDSGTHQLVSGFRSKGSAARWLVAMSKTEDYPLIGFAVFSSLAAPLLTIFGIPNLVIDYAYTTSTGKTTALKAAASCWGNPGERTNGSLIKSWHSTRVFVERAASLFHSLPLILDETKRAKRPDEVAQFVYDHASGQSKNLGNIVGTRKTGYWHSVLLSSGESKVTSFSADAGGAHARVLSIWGAPFGKPRKSKAVMINEFTNMIEANYGHAGPRLVSHVLKYRDSWLKWKAQIRGLAKHYRELAGDNGPAQRQAESFAIIHFAGQLLDQTMGSPWNVEETMASVHKIAAMELSDSDRAKDALCRVFSWANAHSNQFIGRAGQAPYAAGYLGAWENSDEWKNITFFPHKLDEFLSKRGFEPKSVLKTWRDRKWLATEGKKGLTKKVVLDGTRTRCYVVRRRAFDEVTG